MPGAGVNPGFGDAGGPCAYIGIFIPRVCPLL